MALTNFTNKRAVSLPTATITKSLTQAELVEATDLPDNTLISITDLGNAVVKISSTETALTGDVTLDNGQIGVLQTNSEGGYSITWFGCPIDNDKTTDKLTYFNLAADRVASETYSGDSERRAPITVPQGYYYLSEAVTERAIWKLAPGAKMYGLDTVYPSGETDTSYLTGTVIKYDGVDRGRTLRIGDPEFTVQKYTGKAYSAEVTGNAKVAGGITGTSHATINDNSGAGFIGGTFVAVSNNETADTRVYGTYVEAYVTEDSATGSGAYCTESTIFNDKAEPVKQSPNSILDSGTGATWNQWLTTGGQRYDQDGNVYQVSGNTTGAIGIRGKEGSKYDRGIIVKANSIDSMEIVAAPDEYIYSWYGVTTSNEELVSAYISGQLTNDDSGQLQLRVYNSTTGDMSHYISITNTALRPVNYNPTLGVSDVRFETAYLVNSPDVSSDETLKSVRDDDGELTDTEREVALEVAKLPRIFQWISEISSKEGTGATVYLHCSPMVQSIISVFTDAGLDYTLYGFINDGGDEGTMSLQPQELLWMICCAQQYEIESIKERLDAIGA